jgi:hypothetical protein
MNKPRWLRWAVHATRMETKNDASRDLVGNTEKKRPLGRSKLRERIILY